MRHLLTKFLVAVSIFVALLWFGLQKQQENLARFAEQAAELSKSDQ